MKINDILAKMLRKEELTEAERKFLETYREPKPDTSKLTELQQQLDQLRAANEELQSKLDEKDDKGKTEAERLQNELSRTKTKLAAAEKERDSIRAEKDALEFDNSVGALAAEHKFSDREYLKYLAVARKLDVKDKEAAKSFMENLKKESPKYFDAEVNRGGGGTGRRRRRTRQEHRRRGQRGGSRNCLKSRSSRFPKRRKLRSFRRRSVTKATRTTNPGGSNVYRIRLFQ